MSDKCKHCMYFEANMETYPFCIACAYCRKRIHILQVHLDGTLPIFCQVCHYQEWNKEFNEKVSSMTKTDNDPK